MGKSEVMTLLQLISIVRLRFCLLQPEPHDPTAQIPPGNRRHREHVCVAGQLERYSQRYARPGLLMATGSRFLPPARKFSGTAFAADGARPE
jgi:hypothetical protein